MQRQPVRNALSFATLIALATLAGCKSGPEAAQETPAAPSGGQSTAQQHEDVYKRQGSTHSRAGSISVGSESSVGSCGLMPSPQSIAVAW